VAAAARLGVNATCSNKATWAANATPKPAFSALRRLSLGVLKSSKGIGVPPDAEKLVGNFSLDAGYTTLGVTRYGWTRSSYKRPVSGLDPVKSLIWEKQLARTH
jgi:hypothetical protein